MTENKFTTLMQNISDMCGGDLRFFHRYDLYAVSYSMTSEQLHKFCDLLVAKNVAYRRYGHTYIYGLNEELE